ncbi:ubiquitin carboxyl-terminal hydrolase Usp2 isoform X3 [Anopheles moucheti]|uniref:ubiquitin carboxyl-terminal hydrolase Usp2 isoform X3 n=1 Tax=Anopheles moucheti TaxID=186751 RepID=UPI0022F0D163|nr:ubiquitin carboxyl-terminal hydrolase Usp2 isoform X3 [Anopheles moucheti]
MPVISAYSSSGSRYIQPPSSTLTRSNYSDRIYYSPLLSNNKTYSISNSGLYRKSSYRFDTPFSSTTSSSLYHRREERDYSSKNRTLCKNSEVTSDSLKATVDTNEANTNGGIDSIKNSERRTTNSNRSSRYSSTVSNYAAPTSLRSSGNYVSNLRNTALSGAEIYQRYSISNYKPSSSVATRITQSSLAYTGSLQDNSNLNKDSSLVVSPEDRHHYNNNSKLRHSVDLHNTVKPSRNYHDQSTTENDATTSSSRLSTSLKSSYEQLSDTTDSSRSSKAGLCGLWNIGNTCFMNSMIQCLSNTRELTSFLRSQPSTELGTNKDHRILAEYTKLIKNMWSGSQRSINPSDLKHTFSSKHRMYSGSAQQDAQEFLRFFLDSLHGALNVAVKRDPLGEIDDAMNSRVKADMLWEWYSKAENSVIKDLFVGQLRSTLKCTHCDTESTMFDPFWDLSLPLPTSNSRCKLENCLEMFIKEEILDGIDQPTCSHCETRRKCTKSLTIERFPRYLVIHLKRFSETRFSKLTNTVEFPTKKRELNLQPYASEDISGPVYYSLYGISNHIGSTAGGHYVAVCKHPTIQEWNEFNDNYVSETSERNLVTSNAYVLFYERA